MAKRALKKVPKTAKAGDPAKQLREALAKRTKDDLIGLLNWPGAQNDGLNLMRNHSPPPASLGKISIDFRIAWP